MTERRVVLPHFLLVGAAKSGTTSLTHYLKQHPQIFMPALKEPMFFSPSYAKNIDPGNILGAFFHKNKIVSDYEEYLRLFRKGKNSMAVGEASTAYLFLYREAVPRIIKCLQDPKIIIILRNPAERAFSAFCHIVRDTGWDISFERFLSLEKEEDAAGWEVKRHVLRSGDYFHQVEAFLRHFTRVHVLLYDDMRLDAAGMMKDLYRFLGVDEHFCPDLSARWNVSGVPSHRGLYRWIFRGGIFRGAVRPLLRPLMGNRKFLVWKESLRAGMLKRQELGEEARTKLLGIYQENIVKLQALIGRDLSHWIHRDKAGA